VIGKVLGHVAEDRLIVQWPGIVNQEDVDDLIGLHEWSLGSLIKNNKSLGARAKVASVRLALWPFDQGQRQQFKQNPSMYNPLKMPQVIDYLEKFGMNRSDTQNIANEYDRVLRTKLTDQNKNWQTMLDTGKAPNGFVPKANQFGDYKGILEEGKAPAAQAPAAQAPASQAPAPQAPAAPAPQAPAAPAPAAQAPAPAAQAPAPQAPAKKAPHKNPNAPQKYEDYTKEQIHGLVSRAFDKNGLNPKHYPDAIEELSEDPSFGTNEFAAKVREKIEDLKSNPHMEEFTESGKQLDPSEAMQNISGVNQITTSSKRLAAIKSLKQSSELLKGLGDVHVAKIVNAAAKVSSSIHYLFENEKTRNMSSDRVARLAWGKAIVSTLAATEVLRLQNKLGRSTIANDIDIKLFEALTYDR
jgi:hypothetical protein